MGDIKQGSEVMAAADITSSASSRVLVPEGSSGYVTGIVPQDGREPLLQVRWEVRGPGRGYLHCTVTPSQVISD